LILGVYFRKNKNNPLAPQGQMQGGATQAMREHRRGAPTQQMALRRSERGIS
jgi:hypothetical protein